ncbi:MAG: triose-phosphate isomerase [Thermoplasmataceae archaeon]
MNRFIVNLKAYENVLLDPEGFISPLNETVSKNFSLMFAVPAINITALSSLFPEKIIAQHVDPFEYGAHTGSVLMESLIQYGVRSSLINHSEKRIPENVIVDTIKKADRLNFDLVVCCENLREIELYSSMGGHIIAYEPPELIGGEISVSSAKPEIIREGVKICERSDSQLLVGAGVKQRVDVIKSLEYGASGILISSGITKSSNPLSALNSLTLS